MASNPAVLARRARLSALAAVAACALLLAACGGGGGGGGGGGSATSAAPNAAAAAAVVVDEATRRRNATAEALYAGVPRLPDNFALDAAPAGATGPVATLHLKNTDLGATAPTPRHELCSSDAAEALGWSERRANWQGSYADLVETSASARMFEFVRVPRADTTARLRHRIFQCDYLDRAGSDLDADTGAAGTLKLLPVDAAKLQAIAEYLWQFTAFNNADHVVLLSTVATAASGQAAWRIEMARLTRGATAADCDRIERLAWTHTANVATGALERRLETLETFLARRDNGVVQLCRS